MVLLIIKKLLNIVDLTNFFFWWERIFRLWQKFRESNGSTKKFSKALIWRNIFLVGEKFSFFHHSVEIVEILSYTFFSNILLLTNHVIILFLPKWLVST